MCLYESHDFLSQSLVSHLIYFHIFCMLCDQYTYTKLSANIVSHFYLTINFQEKHMVKKEAAEKGSPLRKAK